MLSILPPLLWLSFSLESWLPFVKSAGAMDERSHHVGQADGRVRIAMPGGPANLEFHFAAQALKLLAVELLFVAFIVCLFVCL